MLIQLSMLEAKAVQTMFENLHETMNCDDDSPCIDYRRCLSFNEDGAEFDMNDRGINGGLTDDPISLVILEMIERNNINAEIKAGIAKKIKPA